MRRNFALLAALLAVLSASGCTLLRSRGDTQALSQSTVLAGHVLGPSGHGGGTVWVVAYPVDDAPGTTTHQVRLAEPGPFEMVVPQGSYRLAAFRDDNANQVFDPGEVCGQAVDRIPAEEAPGRRSGWPVIEIRLGTAPGNCMLAPGTRFGSGALTTSHSLPAGSLARLDESAYASERGREGYWQPLQYLHSTGGNIVFIEAYDAQRIPVLFVHGAAGSPQDWRYFIAHLDRSRYQPWVFHYPSGAALDFCAELLRWKLASLQARLHLKTLVIAAHSMGGLVVRRLLVDHDDRLPPATLFLSLSTPWGGDDRVEAGIRLSPAVVPSWQDLVPAGGFIASLFASPLPPGVEHHLLFSHRSRSPRSRPGSDGTVRLDSQLSWPAQNEARTVRGFDEDHDSILNSPRVLRHVQALLNAHADAHADVQGAGLISMRLKPGAALSFSGDSAGSVTGNSAAITLKSTM